MLKYIIKRIVLLIPVLLGVSLVIFTIMHFVPGDPAKVLLGSENVTEAMLEAKRAELGLNDPFIVQFGRFLKQTFIDFDFGQSYVTRTSVAAEIALRFPKTLLLAALCMVLQIIIGIPLGIIAATHQNGIADGCICNINLRSGLQHLFPGHVDRPALIDQIGTFQILNIIFYSWT